MSVKSARTAGLILFVLINACFVLYAQDRFKPYLVPQTVYVGDLATLVVPLPAQAASAGDITLDPRSPGFPAAPDIDIRRVALERRPSGSRLLVEFAAFAPGVLELPPIEIGGEYFSSLKFEVSSIMENGKTIAELSGLAPPLAIPGTGFLIYGTMAALALFLLTGFWALIRGHRRLNGWMLRWKRRRLIASLRSVEKILRKNLLKEGKCREALNRISAEFRSFLSFFTGKNCRAMTPAELGCLSLSSESGNQPELLNGGFFVSFFRRCDELRFSGAEIPDDDVLYVLGELRRFLGALEKAEKERSRTREQAA
jgi:hypothetical protein